jgi:peptidoglycan hydrolase-like protein with peptidoglycan-binding domain
VQEIQGLLSQLKYEPGPADGRQGPRTRRAIEQYQHNEGLPVTGQASTELATALKHSVATMKQAQLASIDEVSNTEPASVSSSRNKTQLVRKVSPATEETENASDIKGASEPVSKSSWGSDEADPRRYTAEERSESFVLAEGSTALSGKNTPVTSANEQQSGSSQDQVDIDPTNITEASKNTSTATDIFVFPWLFAILGLAVFGIIAMIFARLVVPRINGSSEIRNRSDQRVGPAEDTIPSESGGVSGQTFTSIGSHTQFDGQQNKEAQTKRKLRKSANKVVKLQPTTGLVAEETGDTILHAITDFDDIIEETERVLSLNSIDRNTRGHIVEAVEIARSMIEKTLSSNPGEGNDYRQTARAIKEATRLIKDVLKTNPDEAHG